MKPSSVGTLLLTLALSLTAASADTLFDTLRALDGKSFPGRMTFPADPNHDMNKPLRITVQVVSEQEVRIPLQVGEDRSRTWILQRTDSRVQLKHEHRHADGTPDEVTNYGGQTSQIELGTLLVFPADQETRALLPEAATNTWSLRIAPDGSRLYYYLERHSKPRFEASFDLTAPLGPGQQ
jgi:hypothetical protein